VQLKIMETKMKPTFFKKILCVVYGTGLKAL